jgi:hypothetical protein
MGWRYIRSQVHGTGQMGFTSIVKTASYDPNNPNAAGDGHHQGCERRRGVRRRCGQKMDSARLSDAAADTGR